MHRQTLTLTPTPPFDFAQTLRFIHGFAPGEGEQQLAGETLTRAIRVNRQTTVCRITSVGTTDAPALTVDLVGAAPITSEVLSLIQDRISFWLSLADDLAPFYAVAAEDTAFAPTVGAWYGYHQVKFLTPFDNACWAVLAQRSPLTASRAMKDRLVARYGDTILVDGETYTAFPEAADVAGATPADLAETLGHARKADYLHAVIQAAPPRMTTWSAGCAVSGESACGRRRLCSSADWGGWSGSRRTTRSCVPPRGSMGILSARWSLLRSRRGTARGRAIGDTTCASQPDV